MEWLHDVFAVSYANEQSAVRSRDPPAYCAEKAVPNMIGHDPFKVFYDLVLSISVSCWLVMSISAYLSLCVCPT